MSVELDLKRIAPNQVGQMRDEGVKSVLDGLHEHWTPDDKTWLRLDEHILGFMRHENPKHALLYKVVMGGTAFPDSLGRDDYPRYFSVEEVKQLTWVLDAVSEDDIQTRFDAVRDLFGEICVGGTDDQALARLQTRFKEIAQHYRQAAENGEAMLLLLF